MKETTTTKRKNIKRAITIAITAILALSSCISPCFAATNKPSIQQRITSFTSDNRWKHGISWSSQRPKISSYNCSQCMAYTADFAKYVYGVDNPRAGTKYTNISDIRVGDVIYISPEHWFAVTAKNGNVLTCAEGNYSGKVRVGGKRTIDISNNRFLDGVDNRSFVCGYHFTDKTDYSTPPTPAKVSGLKVTKATKSSISLSWNKVPGNNIKYEVYADGKRVATTTKTTFTQSGLKANTCHTYQIRATVTYYGWDYTYHTLYGQRSIGLINFTKKK